MKKQTPEFEFASDISKLNLPDANGRTPLMIAASKGDLNLINFLVGNGADPSIAGIRGLTPLHEASANGMLEAIRLFAELGCDLNARTEDGVTPLMCAAAWGYIDAVKYLLKRGAEKSLRDDIGATASDIANEKGEDEVSSFISDYTYP